MTADNIPYQFLLCALAALRGDGDGNDVCDGEGDSGSDVTADGDHDDGDGCCNGNCDRHNNNDDDDDGDSNRNVTLFGHPPTSPGCALPGLPEPESASGELVPGAFETGA